VRGKAYSAISLLPTLREKQNREGWGTLGIVSGEEVKSLGRPARATFCLKKTEEAWRIEHRHTSKPFKL
jgi:hypothetical protein